MTAVSLTKLSADTPVSLTKRPHQTGVCTCHAPDPGAPFRKIIRFGDEPWQHASDGTPAQTVHAHLSHYGSDCDGVTGSERVSRPRPDEDDHGFWSRVVECMVDAHSPGTFVLSDDPHGLSVTWDAPTEEGWAHRDARRCFDPVCAYRAGRAYDQFARAAGY